MRAGFPSGLSIAVVASDNRASTSPDISHPEGRVVGNGEGLDCARVVEGVVYGAGEGDGFNNTGDHQVYFMISPCGPLVWVFTTWRAHFAVCLVRSENSRVLLVSLMSLMMGSEPK